MSPKNQRAVICLTTVRRNSAKKIYVLSQSNDTFMRNVSTWYELRLEVTRHTRCGNDALASKFQTMGDRMLAKIDVYLVG